MIKIAQIGIAHDHAEGKMACVRKFPDVFDVVGIAEETLENIDKFSGKPCYDGIPLMSVEELLSSPGLDAVMIETEELKLVETAQRCVDKGLHVHIDKPAGDNVTDFEKLLKNAKSKKLAVQLAYMYRYNPAIQYCLAAVKSGRLGEIYQVDAIMNTYHVPEKRAWMNAFPGGNMFYLGCHMVDLVILMNGVPDKIIPMNKQTGFDGVRVYDHGFAVFEYKNGISTVCATSNEVNGFGRRQLVVCGSKGTIEIKPLEYAGFDTNPVMTLSLKEMTQGNEYADCKCEIPLPAVTGRYDAMMLDFAEIVKGNKKNPFTYEYELLVQKAVLSACGQSIDVKYSEIIGGHYE